MRAVAKQQHRRLGEIHAHCRLADDAAADVDRNFSPAQMCFLRDNDMRLDRGFEILVENGAETAFDVTPQCLADFGLLARYIELHGSSYPLRAGFGFPTKDVGTRAC